MTLARNNVAPWGSKHVGAILSVLMWNFFKCICWLIIKVILRNARCNNKDNDSCVFGSITQMKFTKKKKNSTLNLPIKLRQKENFSSWYCVTAQNDLENVFLRQQIKCFYSHLAQNAIPILRLNRNFYLIKWWTVKFFYSVLAPEWKLFSTTDPVWKLNTTSDIRAPIRLPGSKQLLPRDVDATNNTR